MRLSCDGFFLKRFALPISFPKKIMKNIALSTAFLSAFLAFNVQAADAVSGATMKVNIHGTEMPDNVDAVTSASVVQKAYRQNVKPNGFKRNTNKVRVLFVVGDPRHESVEWDMVNTAMRHFMDKGCEVELRDLYALNWNPVITRENFYQAKDGFGKTPEDVAIEQLMVAAADYIVFAYPNWHDTPNAMVKGYMERVFQKQFAYRDTDKGLEGLLKDKAFFTIMNCGWIGQGRGGLGDGLNGNKIWDKYLTAFKTLDEDTAAFWGMKTLGRFCNDQTPANVSKNYEKEIKSLRADLVRYLDKTFVYKK